MKKGIKKFVAMTIAAALAASSLTGCSSFSGKSAGSASLINGAENDAVSQETNNGGDSSEEGYVGQETDTVQWFNASYAILTKINGNDYNVFGGGTPNVVSEAMYQAMLENSWSVTDRESADETLDWILTEGHRVGFVDEGKFYTEQEVLEGLSKEEMVQLLEEELEYSEEDAQYIAMVYEMYTEYGDSAIDAWDYCRALSLMSFYYMAGYYTKEEALDKSLEIAQTLQPMYDSWDELVDGYLRGYEYWAEEDSTERREIYEDLLKADDNPFRVDYNTTLEKTW